MRSDAGFDEGRSFAIRLSPQANRDVTEAAVHLDASTSDPLLAKEWMNGLYAAVGKLATGPKRCPVAEWETKLLRQETRRMIYRRTATSVAYLILFAVIEEGADGPLITIIHVRHGGRKPITRAEARQILAGQ